MFEFVEFSVVSLHAFKLIIVGPDPGGSSEGVLLPVSTNLWNIWERVVVELSSLEGGVCVQVRFNILLPSFSVGSGFVLGEGVISFVSSHGISPGLVDTGPFRGMGSIVSPGFAVIGIFISDGSSASSRYNISGGFPEVAKAFFGVGVAGGGGLS